MSKNTTNYELIKPDLTDAADITTMNKNWDIIDEQLFNHQNEILPVERGGTGVTKLDDFYATWTYHLAPNNCSNKDFNTLKKAGYYFGYTGMTNAAFTSEISVLEVIPYSNDWVLQRQTRLTDGIMKMRFYSGVSGWSEWYVIYTSKHHNDVPNVFYGTYTGNNNFGKNNANIITVDFTPRLVILQGQVLFQRRLEHGWDFLHYDKNDSNSLGECLSLEWGENSVSWYNEKSASQQFNSAGTAYTYVVFG